MVSTGVDPGLLSALVTAMIAVIAVLGAFVKKNTQFRLLVEQRLFGSTDDDTYNGFFREHADWREDVTEKLDSHAEQTHGALEDLETEVVFIEQQVERVEQKVDTVAEVVEEEHDVFFRGGEPHTDGGRVNGPVLETDTDDDDEEQEDDDED